MSRIRPFEERDRGRYVEIGNASYPEYGWTIEESRHEDSTWTDPKFFLARHVLEDDGRRVIAFMDLQHQRLWFHPRRYRCEVFVDPAVRGRGHGSALLDFASALARDRGGELLIGSTKESMTDVVRFLTARGCVERQRSWESRLDVGAVDLSRFAGATERAAREGVRLTTLGREMAVDRERALRQAFEVAETCHRDIPSVDSPTAGDFDLFRAHLAAPTFLADAYFLAVKDGTYVGLSNLWKDLTDEGILYQGLTGVTPEWRRRGVAMALKLETVGYARERGKREIRTWNDTRNRPMLRINEALGFVKQPAWIEFEKRI